MHRIREAYSAALESNLEKLVTIGPSSPNSTRLDLVTGILNPLQILVHTVDSFLFIKYEITTIHLQQIRARFDFSLSI